MNEYIIDLVKRNQASFGNISEYHSTDRIIIGEKFEDQPIMTIAKGHGLGYQTGQAAKKLQEAHTLLKLRGKHAADNTAGKQRDDTECAIDKTHKLCCQAKTSLSC